MLTFRLCTRFTNNNYSLVDRWKLLRKRIGIIRSGRFTFSICQQRLHTANALVWKLGTFLPLNEHKYLSFLLFFLFIHAKCELLLERSVCIISFDFGVFMGVPTRYGSYSAEDTYRPVHSTDEKKFGCGCDRSFHFRHLCNTQMPFLSCRFWRQDRQTMIHLSFSLSPHSGNYTWSPLVLIFIHCCVCCCCWVFAVSFSFFLRYYTPTNNIWG